MATLDTNETYATLFSSLLSPAITALLFLSFGLGLEWYLKQLKRSTIPATNKNQAKLDGLEDRLISSESFAMGYLFRARTYAIPSLPDSSSLPLKWILEAILRKESEFELLGGDTITYIRLLRAWWIFTGLLTLTVFPLLFGLHFHFSDASGLSSSSIDRVSISSLVQANNVEGKRVLWVHVVVIYFSLFIYFGLMLWVARGTIQYRRKSLRKLIEVDAEGEDEGIEMERRGWRCRTVLIKNIPIDLRNEKALEEFLYRRLRPTVELDLDLGEGWKKGNLVQSIQIIRRITSLNSAYDRREKILGLLEAAHTTLALTVMAHVTQLSKTIESDYSDDDNLLLKSLSPFLQSSPPTQSIWSVLHELPRHLLDRFQPLLRLKFFRGQKIPAIDYYFSKLAILTATVEQDRADQDRFPATSLAFVTFYSQADARKAREIIGGPLLYRPFKKAEINIDKARSMRCQPAPATTDLIWQRLVKVSTTKDVIRSVFFQSIIWIATLIYLLPVSAALSLISFSSISKITPAFSNYLLAHPVIKSLLINLLPSLIIALLGMLTPTLIGMLTRHGEVFYTTSSLFAAIQARYWKWLIINLIVVFCIGLSAFSAFLDIFRSTNPASILNILAAAFPKGAVFFVSWIILVTGIHHGIETGLFGIPLINHASIRKQRSPRERASQEGAWPRAFMSYYWLPNHLLVVAVVVIFSLLNPLVIPFSFVYFSFAVIVFQNQFYHIFYRRWFELNGRLIFRRAFRYSLDSFIFAEFVIMAFFFVSLSPRLGYSIIPLIPLTVFVKVIGTRWFDRLMDEISEVEDSLRCGEYEPEEIHDGPEAETTTSWISPSAFSNFAKVTLPSLSLRPNERRSASTNSQAKSRLRADSRASLQPLTKSSEIVKSPLSAIVDSSPRSNHSEKRLQQPITITPHDPIVWDDRPDFHARYENPALTKELETSLWLPANPLLPVDLGDTVDYHLGCLVSSTGVDRDEGIEVGLEVEMEDGIEMAKLSMRADRGSEDLTGDETVRVSSGVEEAVEGSTLRLSRFFQRQNSSSPNRYTSSPSPLNPNGIDRYPLPSPSPESTPTSVLPPATPSRLSSSNYFPRRTSSSLVATNSHRTSSAIIISQSSALRKELEAETNKEKIADEKERQEERDRAIAGDSINRSWFHRFVARASEAEVET